MSALRRQFALRRISDVLYQAKDVATAFALVSGRLTPLGFIGLLAHLTTLGVNLASKDIEKVAASWHALPFPPEVYPLCRASLESTVVKRDSAWALCMLPTQAALCRGEGGAGAVYAEKDVGALVDEIRTRAWASMTSARLAPVGRWGDGVALLPAPAPVDLGGTIADAAWSRVGPFIAAGRPRSILIDGPPGVGKSTAAESLAHRVGGRTLRIVVGDFQWLRASVVDAALQLLLPDVVLIDDLDRFDGIDKLLDLLQAARTRHKLVIATTNERGKLPGAARRPRRFDELLDVGPPGHAVAATVLGAPWTSLTEAERNTVAGWPRVYVDELRERLELLATTPAREVADLAARAADETGAKAAAEKAAAEAAAVASAATMG